MVQEFQMGKPRQQPGSWGTWIVFVRMQPLVFQSRFRLAESAWRLRGRGAAWAQSLGASRVPSSLCVSHKGRVFCLCCSSLSLATLSGESLSGLRPNGGSSQPPHLASALSQMEKWMCLWGGSLSPVPVPISRSSPRNIAEQTPALVAAPFVSGWLSLHLPHSWPKYCRYSTSSFLPSWQWCRQKQPINMFSFWASVLDPDSSACTCNTCNSQWSVIQEWDASGFELCIPEKPFSSVWQRSQRLSLKLYYCFHCVFFDLPNPFCFVFVFSLPEQHAQHLKDKAGWCTQALSSIGVAGREEGAAGWLWQSICGCCPQLAHMWPSCLKWKHSRSPKSSLMGLAELISWNHSIT